MLKYELFSLATLINGVYLMFLLLGIVLFVMFDPTMCYRYMIDEQVSIIVAVITILFIRIKYLQFRMSKKGLSRGFENVKDLVRGTIVTDITQLWKAYEHFSKLNGVEIFEIKSLKKVEML